MSKKIDLSQTIYELTQEYAELIDILVQLGFTEIKIKELQTRSSFTIVLSLPS